jgi:pimeloyl-ACP methyl ester carboxylesterase
MFRKLVLFAVFLLTLSLTPTLAQSKGPVFVLVHGAFQDATGWAPVVKALEAKGATAVTVEWAGRGSDKTPFKDITLDNYRDAVVNVINQQDAPVILVGHSFGGIVISDVAEAVPDRIQTLVYLAAYLPRTGESLVSLSGLDKYSVLGQQGNFIVSADYTTASIKKDVFASAFCPDCNPEQLKAVAASQLDEPLAPPNTKVTLTDKNFGSVHKAYILTAQDMVVSPQLQALMLANTPVDHVYAVDAGHAAYVTVPDKLADILLQAAGTK